MTPGAESPQATFPREPIDRMIQPLARFLHVEAASGVMLLLAAVVALALANSPFAESFLASWRTPVSFGIGHLRIEHSLRHWVSDGLMAVFFFVLGLEVKREMVLGELRDLRQAALPLAAAIGGMAIPALIYVGLQWGQPAARGWGIPMATDVAFVVGCLALLGPRVPPGLRVFLLSLAIVDDIGAILVIAVGYTSGLQLQALLLGVAGLALVLVSQRLGVRAVPFYVALGAAIWFAFHESGVHATIAGVTLGLLTPARPWVSARRFAHLLDGARAVWHGERGAGSSATHPAVLERAAREAVSPLERLEKAIHPWVAFVVMPIFVLANAGVAFRPALVTDAVALAVAAGLVVGKPAGVLLFSYLAVRLGLARLPAGLDWSVLLGGGFLAGIGFTMSIFMAGLALPPEALDAAKAGVLGASLISGALGMALLGRGGR